MQLKDFYALNDLTVIDDVATAKITVNKDHEIFKGHFPGNPVTPGVCMMQIVKELTEEVLDQKLMLRSSSNIKFLTIINPEKSPNLNLTLSISKNDDEYTVKNSTTFDETEALKMTLNFCKVKSH